MIAVASMEIINAHHQRDWIFWAKKCIENEDVLNQVMNYMLEGNTDAAKHAAEIIRHVYDLCRTRIEPYLEEMIDCTHQPCHDAVLRSIFHCTQSMPIPEQHEGRLLEICLPFISNRDYPIVVRVFAMTTAYNISKKYPELYSELCDIIRPILPMESTGFQNRGNKILNKTWK